MQPRTSVGQRGLRATLRIGLINNMPDAALQSTEAQFFGLLKGAAGSQPITVRLSSFPELPRSAEALAQIGSYWPLEELLAEPLDAFIVTGTEPKAARLADEPYWPRFAQLLEYAESRRIASIWSCLAAHAAVKHLDGVERHRLSEKCSGVYDCSKAGADWLTRGLPATLKVSHSRYNELREHELAARGYEILTRSDIAGVDIFARQLESRFIFFQGHPEYDPSSLQREYMRDLARFLSGERDSYPNIPVGYFDAATVIQLESFEQRARANRDPVLAAELPGLTLRPDIAAGAAANTIFRNWLGFLREEAREPASSRK